MRVFSYRLLNLYSVLIAVFLLATAAYMQLAMQLPPCPLCIMQRLIVVLLGILFIPGIFYIPKKAIVRKSINIVIALIAVFGMAIAARHIYLQHLPPDAVPSCGPGLNFLFKNLPIGEAIKMLLMGSGECSEIHWQFLHLSLPEWTLFFFILFFIIAIIQMFNRRLR